MKYDLEQIICITNEIVSQYPDRVDVRAERGLAPRYVEHGEPCCLVAKVLTRLGWSVSQLKMLDCEGLEKHRGGGVQLALSQNLLLKRISPDGLAFLNYIQQRQDCQWSWSKIMIEAFKGVPSGIHWQCRDRRSRPWMYIGCEN